jgi:hypothetical protein
MEKKMSNDHKDSGWRKRQIALDMPTEIKQLCREARKTK